METVRAVTLDLLHFVFVEYFGYRPTTTPLPLLSAEKNRSYADTKTTEPEVVLAETEAAGDVVYAATPTVSLFASPVAAFDGVITIVPYGTALGLLRTQNRWCEVSYREQRGWVLRDDITETSLSPQFLSGQTYEADSKEATMLRSYLLDEFYGAALHAPLQDVEYVAYRLKKKGRSFPWGTERPRTPGSWQRLLRGRPGVHIGVAPKTDAVMEVIYEDDTGHVAYVEAVFPDESILISEFGYPENGQFTARTLQKEEWRELRPIFITIA